MFIYIFPFRHTDPSKTTTGDIHSNLMMMRMRDHRNDVVDVPKDQHYSFCYYATHQVNFAPLLFLFQFYFFLDKILCWVRHLSISLCLYHSHLFQYTRLEFFLFFFFGCWCWYYFSLILVLCCCIFIRRDHYHHYPHMLFAVVVALCYSILYTPWSIKIL